MNASETINDQYEPPDLDSYEFGAPWLDSMGKALDHHAQDEPYMTEFLANQRVFPWLYVKEALLSLDKQETLNFFISSTGLETYDKGNLSTRRYYAEELGLKVGGFNLNLDYYTAAADLRPYGAGELPPAPSKQADGTWHNFHGQTLPKGQVDRYFSARYLAHNPEHPDRQWRSYSELVHSTVEQALHEGVVEVDAREDEGDYREILSLVRRITTLSGCELGGFRQTRDERDRIRYSATVFKTRPDLSLFS